MLQIPFFSELKDAKHILLGGAGVGFDVYGTLPFYFHLLDLGKKVDLVSFTSTDIRKVKARKVSDYCSIVTYTNTTEKPSFYFPEKYLTDWFYEKKQMDVPIYTLHPVGPKLLGETYSDLREELGFDAIILVDGGTDSLMQGDEKNIRPPPEDATSILAVDSLNLKMSYLICIGFGVDVYHGVSNHHTLRAISEFMELGAYKGSFGMMKEMSAVQAYMDAVKYANTRCTSPSIVQNSIISALDGNFGERLIVEKARLLINPMMSQAWCFDLSAVADRYLHARWIVNATDLSQVESSINQFRRERLGR